MELKVAERLMLLNLLPQEGDIVTLRVVREAQQVIGLSEDELKELEIHNPTVNECLQCGAKVEVEPGAVEIPCTKCGGVALRRTTDSTRLVWKQSADVLKDIAIGPRATSIIAEKLEALNTDKKLTMQQVGLYEKFVEPPEPDEKVRPIKK